MRGERAAEQESVEFPAEPDLDQPGRLLADGAEHKDAQSGQVRRRIRTYCVYRALSGQYSVGVGVCGGLCGPSSR